MGGTLGDMASLASGVISVENLGQEWQYNNHHREVSKDFKGAAPQIIECMTCSISWAYCLLSIRDQLAQLLLHQPPSYVTTSLPNFIGFQV